MPSVSVKQRHVVSMKHSLWECINRQSFWTTLWSYFVKYFTYIPDLLGCSQLEEMKIILPHSVFWINVFSIKDTMPLNGHASKIYATHSRTLIPSLSLSRCLEEKKRGHRELDTVH